MFAILSSWVPLSLCVCPHISSRNLFRASQGQTSLALITWGRGDGCNRRGDDAAGVECGELLHLNRRHRGNRREVGRLSHQGLLLHELQDRQTVHAQKHPNIFKFIDAQMTRSTSWHIWRSRLKIFFFFKRSKRININALCVWCENEHFFLKLPCISFYLG